MHRRSFIKNTGLCAVALSATGFIKFDGANYVGDCETTTDIIGPFYRPNAPVRSNMLVKNAAGQVMELRGVVKHKDCKTPLANACIEIWHCSPTGEYDNESAEFLYRAKGWCDADGQYSFRTMLPVPYSVGEGITRPAHFHLLISAPGYQSLVTQLYFTGDPWLAKDQSSASPSAKRRILEIKDVANGEKRVEFNVSMMEHLPAEAAAVQRLTGKYIGETDKNRVVELFEKDGILWRKNDTPTGGQPYYYTGNNSFTIYGGDGLLQFELGKDHTRLINSWTDNDGKNQRNVLTKER